MEKVKFVFRDGSGEDEFFVLEETKINGAAYILVSDSEDDDGECLILKEVEEESQPESVYEIVEDETELAAVSKVFEELLEDVIIENKQAIEMANIYSNILSGTMDAFASVISNNLNIVMKFLTTITIVMSVPNIVFSAYGMNVNSKGMPFASSPFGFWIAILIAAVICLIVAMIFKKKDMF